MKNNLNCTEKMLFIKCFSEKDIKLNFMKKVDREKKALQNSV